MTMRNVMLLCVGSFNPITFMHLRLFVLAKDYLYQKLQWNVLGGFISPVHDGYKKKDLASAKHRIRMIELALEEHNIPWIKLSKWEIEQQTWTRTLDCLEQHQILVNGSKNFQSITNIEKDDKIQVMLLCGSDVIQSFTVPGLWSDHQIETICRKFGIVCITREGSVVQDTIRNSPILSKFEDDIIIVPEWFPNQVSSTSIRDAVRKGLSIGLLVPMNVAEYIKQERLYQAETDNKKLLVFVFKALKASDAVDPYADALEKNNWRVALVPVLNFQFIALSEYQDALSQPESYSGLILTTPRTVEALALAIKADEAGWKGKYLSQWNARPIYAVGEGTAAQARAMGFTSICGETAGCEANLAHFIKANKEKHQVKLLFPCGDLRLETLRLSLNEQNIAVEFVEVYQTSAHPKLASIIHENLETQGIPDVNLFFSPSGVQFVDEILRAESIAFKQTKYVAIGPTTAEALKRAGYAVSAVASHPNPEGIVEALKRFNQ